jgi:hypothetical protein
LLLSINLSLLDDNHYHLRLKNIDIKVISFNLGCRCLARPAAAQELQQVAINIEPGIIRQLLLNLAQIAAGEIHHRAAVGTDKVMMMLRWSSQQVAATVAPGVYLADETQFGKQADGSIYGDQAYVTVLALDLFVYGRGRKVIVTVGYDAKYNASLRG